MKPVDKAILESPVAVVAGSPGKKKVSGEQEAAARELLVQWTGLNKVRSWASIVAFGATVCGVLLVNRPAHK